jgi:hypothetical protein
MRIFRFGRAKEAGKRLPTWERHCLGGTEVVKAVSDANRAYFVQNLQNSHREPARTLNAAYLLPWERRRLGGTEVVKAVSDANRAYFVQNLQNSHREPARTPALPGRPGCKKYGAFGETLALPG